ncbi:MAG: HAD-IA family hydrolase [Candidatus Marsarchaeota archaeon]|nr:HAD-IA family hydrolase [Candidatus Marsarchaeota archaeon]
MKLKHLLADFDDTVFKHTKDFDAIVRANVANLICERYSLSSPHEMQDLIKSLTRKHGTEVLQCAVAKDGRISYDEFGKRVYTHRLNELKSIAASNADSELRQLLSELKIDKSILSNSPDFFIKIILKSQGLEGQFQTIIGSTTLSCETKPSPSAYATAIRATGYAPENTVYVDDSPRALEVPRQMGMLTVLGSEEAKSDKNALVVVKDLKELLRML